MEQLTDSGLGAVKAAAAVVEESKQEGLMAVRMVLLPAALACLEPWHRGEPLVVRIAAG